MFAGGLPQQWRWRCVAAFFGVNLLLAMYLWPVLQGPRVARRLHNNKNHGIAGPNDNRLTAHGNLPEPAHELTLTDANIAASIGLPDPVKIGRPVNESPKQSSTTRPSTPEIAKVEKEKTPGNTQSKKKTQTPPRVQQSAQPQKLQDQRTTIQKYDGPPTDGGQNTRTHPEKPRSKPSYNKTENSTPKRAENTTDKPKLKAQSGESLLYKSKQKKNPVLRLPHGHFSIEPSWECSDDTFLFIVVCSAVENFSLRQAIRKTWAMDAERRKLPIKVVFMVGRAQEQHRHLESALIKEGSHFGDVIQQQIVDHYTNLSLKSLGYLRWSGQHCSKAKFVMKTDDDIFINVPNLLDSLAEIDEPMRNRVIMGHVIENAAPIQDRTSKWYTPPSVYKQKVYPAYASGMAYVMSGDLVMKLLKKAYTSDFFWLEDIYITGMLAGQVGASLRHDPRFGYQKRSSNPCVYRLVVTGHQMSPSDLTKLWKNLHKPNLNCPSNHANDSFHFDKTAAEM